MRFCQLLPSVEGWRDFSMKGHRCSGWVYSSLFYGRMRIYSYPLLLISRKYFAYTAKCLVAEKHQSSPCFWPQQSERNAPCPSNIGLRVSCAQASNTVSIYRVSWVNSLCCSPEQELELGASLGLLVELCVKQCPGATALLGQGLPEHKPRFQ